MRTFRQAAVKLEADDFGNQHRKRLAEHGGFCFNAADAPAENTEGVNHGGVRIGANEGIGISFQAIAVGHGADDAREIFDVHLVADAGVRRHDLEITEGVLAPAEKLVALDDCAEIRARR